MDVVRGLQISLLLALAAPVGAAAPSFDCAKAAAGSIEALVCGDDALAALDRQLDTAYRAALARDATLKAEQRGWIKGRNECWKADDRRVCVENEYRQRTAELQARYDLVARTVSATWACPDFAVTVTYYPTDPPSAIAMRGDEKVFLLSAPSGSGAKYAGRNVSVWEHQGEALIAWGVDGKEVTCSKR
jgi:uncharacterized protein